MPLDHPDGRRDPERSAALIPSSAGSSARPGPGPGPGDLPGRGRAAGPDAPPGIARDPGGQQGHESGTEDHGRTRRRAGVRGESMDRADHAQPPLQRGQLGPRRWPRWARRGKARRRTRRWQRGPRRRPRRRPAGPRPPRRRSRAPRPLELAAGPPGDGIPPVEAEHEHLQPAHPVVAAPQVGQLVDRRASRWASSRRAQSASGRSSRGGPARAQSIGEIRAGTSQTPGRRAGPVDRRGGDLLRSSPAPAGRPHQPAESHRLEATRSTTRSRRPPARPRRASAAAIARAGPRRIAPA